MTTLANILRIGMVMVEEVEFRMLQIGHRQEWLPLGLTAATIHLPHS